VVVGSNKIQVFVGGGTFVSKMNIIKNSRGSSRPVAETETRKRPYFRDDNVFVGNKNEAYTVDPTLDDIIAALQSSIRAWSGDGDELEIWDIRCKYKAINLLRMAYGSDAKEAA